MEQAVELGWLARDMVARQAQRRPDALAISDLASGRRLSFAELEDLVRRADGWLRGAAAPDGPAAGDQPLFLRAAGEQS